jgi:hypothetical protein
MPQPVVETLTIRIGDEVVKPKPPKRPKPNPESGDKSGKKEGKGPPAPTHGLPPVVLLTKDGHPVGELETQPWPPGFAELDGGMVEDLGEKGVLYKINYDNTYHLKYRLGARGDVARDVLTEKYILGMRILMLGYEHALRAIKELKGQAGVGMAEFQDDFRRMAARGAASTVLALSENLPKIIDKSSVSAAQDIE